jgi:hypothetical protein
MGAYRDGISQLDREETDREGIKMSASQRALLMQNLMSAHGSPPPPHRPHDPHTCSLCTGITNPTPAASLAPPPSSCVSISNVFDPSTYVLPAPCHVHRSLHSSMCSGGCTLVGWARIRKCRRLALPHATPRLSALLLSFSFDDCFAGASHLPIPWPPLLLFRSLLSF